MKEHLEYRTFVTFVPNKSLPIYNWFKYKEGFSKSLVHKLINEWNVPSSNIVLDPFCGCGTTLLACAEMGYTSVGLDVLPVAVFISKTKLKNWGEDKNLQSAIEKLLQIPFRKPKEHFPDVAILARAFNLETQRDILFFKEQIETFDVEIQPFLLLGLLSILEQVSYTSKDGQFLRIVEKRIPPVRIALKKQLHQMLNDVKQTQASLFKYTPAYAYVFQGDARKQSLPNEYWGRIGTVITSPPYLNRYDYSRTYALELCTLFVDSFAELCEIRHDLIRSHIESQNHTDKEFILPGLNEVLNNLCFKELNNNRIPIMIKGYFEDMNLVIRRLRDYMIKGGLVAMVVGNARFEGELIPTDLLLCELAESNGFSIESIWVTRYKGNSSQQMAKYGRVPVRESIIFWRKK